MKKLLDGIRDFHERVRPSYREKFAHLALGQAPDCLFIACSDSRVVPNLFASTDPGDLFVVRNVGNLIPPADSPGGEGRAAGAAAEFSTVVLGVRDVIVCGHSQCGAMRAILQDEVPGGTPNLHQWLATGTTSVERLGRMPGVGADLPPVERLSQVNVLQQLDNLMTYAAIRDRVNAGGLRLHAWWFDIGNARVLAWHQDAGDFIPIEAAYD